MYEPLAVSGYVLAGGRSSRMGRDKALLELQGRPLVEHAVIKLRRICAQVAVLSSNGELRRFAPLVGDLHPGCGPMGGLEATLAHASYEWSLVLPVDVPLVPTMLLYTWAQATLRHAGRDGTRVALFTVDGVPQPALVMLHRDLAPYLTIALAQKRFKLFPELVAATGDLAVKRGLNPVHVLRCWAWSEGLRFTAGGGEPPGPAWTQTTAEQERETARYFSNLNTPEEFAEVEGHTGLLDT